MFMVTRTIQPVMSASMDFRQNIPLDTKMMSLAALWLIDMSPVRG